MTPSRRNRLLIVAFSALLVVGGIVAKVHVEGVRSLEEADAAWDKGDMDRAQLLYLRAGRWYLPWGSVREHAAARLLTLARNRLETHDWSGAVSAFDDVRALYYGSSSLALVGGDTLDTANREMAAALAGWKRADGAPESQEALQDRYLAQLTVQDVPSPLWSLVMGLSLLGWIGALGVFAWRFDTLHRRWPWIAASAVLFVLWTLSLHFMGP